MTPAESGLGGGGRAEAAPMTRAVAAKCLQALTARGSTVATAESLTAGLISATLASVPGASSALLGGVATYATAAKTTVLHVSQSVIDEHGVISEQCAAAMAESVREVFSATWGISATGVAGPDRQEGRAVGTVYVGIAGPDGGQVRKLSLRGRRDDVRLGSVEGALRLLLGCLEPTTEMKGERSRDG